LACRRAVKLRVTDLDVAVGDLVQSAWKIFAIAPPKKIGRAPRSAIRPAEAKKE
jgi:hypothetical protein